MSYEGMGNYSVRRLVIASSGFEWGRVYGRLDEFDNEAEAIADAKEVAELGYVTSVWSRRDDRGCIFRSSDMVVEVGDPS